MMKLIQYLALLVTGFAQAAAPPSPRFLNDPVPDEVPSFAGWGAGHDFRKLAQAARQLPAEKSEFETAEAHEQRVAAMSSKIGYGNVRLTDRVLKTGALSSKDRSYGPVFYAYDAEKASFRLCLRWNPVMGYPSISGSSLTIESNSQALGEYVGSNSFGAKARVSKSRSHTTQLVVPWDSPGDKCFAAVSMSPEEARAIAGGSVWGLVGHLKAPYILDSHDYIGPTVRDPVEAQLLYANLPFQIDEAVIFDGRTGLVKYRVEGQLRDALR